MKNENYSVGIIGVGSSLPEKVITNKDIEKLVDTSDEWIVKRTGISERRVLEKDETLTSLGIKAAKAAINSSKIEAKDLDLIIVSTETPDYLTPTISCMIQDAIGASKAAAFDMNAACSGMIYGMTVAEQFIKTGCYKYILVIACEGLSKVVDWDDRNTCVLFGDGAGAFLLGPVEEGYGMISSEIGAKGDGAKLITVPACSIDEDDLSKRLHENKRVLWMDGKEVFRFAIEAMPKAALKVVKNAGMTMNDIKIVVPHQANIRIIESAIKRMETTMDKVYVSVHKYGNISSASIPVGVDELFREGKLKKGDNIVLVGFGGGLTWGATLIKWSL